MTVEKQVSLHGGRVALSPDDELLCEKGFISGGGNKPAIAWPSPDTVAVFEDFMSRPTKADTGASGFTDLPNRFGGYFIASRGDSGNTIVLRDAPNGVARLTSSLGTLTPDGGFAGMTGPATQWKANQGLGTTGKLRMGARIRIADVAKIGVMFAGFTDAVGAEFPLYDTGIAGTDTGTNFVSTASDAVGIHYGTRGDTGFMGMAVAGDADRLEIQLDTGTPPSATWITLETEIRRGQGDTGGTAYFYINGRLKGSIESPITSTVGLTPIVCIADHTAQTSILDLDWMAVSGPRDSGE